MTWTCDLTSAWEDGGIGAVVMAVAWGLWSWWRHKSGQQPAQRS